MIDALEIEREKILIVGDNTDVRGLIATLFGATHVILTAHSGKTGLAMAITRPGSDFVRYENARYGRVRSMWRAIFCGDREYAVIFSRKNRRRIRIGRLVRGASIIFPYLSFRRLWKLVFAITYRKKAC